MAFPRSKWRQAKDARIAALAGIDDEVLRRLGLDRRRLGAMEAQFRGTLVYPGSPDYDTDRRESNPAFQAYPKLIAYCAVLGDVKLCLEWAADLGWPIACRSGGHSTAGYSVNDGLVLDMSRFHYVHVEEASKTALVGAGVKFDTLNAALDGHNLHVPGGGCEEVCVGGFMQGGGYGFTSRAFGMNCDNVLSVRVLTPDRGLVVADENNAADLFWAIRGGTGNNFGVLIDILYRLHDLPSVWGFGLRWRLDHAPEALVAMQQGFMQTGASDRLGYMTIVVEQSDGPWLLMRGMYVGSREDGLKELAPLRATPGSLPLQIDKVGSYYELNDFLLSKPEGIPPISGPNPMEDKQAGYIARPLAASDWAAILAYYMKRPSVYDMIVIEPYGGTINAYPRTGNAFIHRDVDMDFFVDTFWAEPLGRGPAVAWLDGFMDLMQPFFTGYVYQNYPRRTLPDYRKQYWSDAFPKLLQVKQRYNSTHLFDYEQSIAPYPDAGAPRR